jgi:signal transduction histidine kinase
MPSSETEDIFQPFRPRARILQLLGDELIGSARLAVFELVKNAYDADAKRVIVRLDLRTGRSPKITVTDNGEGMSPEILRDIWLVPGNEHRQKQREAILRTKKFNRLPLGEKGLGRFAVHKLGNHIRLVTRAAGSRECVVDIDWNELIAQPFLDEAPVRIRMRRPVVFKGRATGTRIEITDLRQQEWTRGEVRRLYGQIKSICSPFIDTGSFTADLKVLGRNEWIADLFDINQILDTAIWKFSFKLENGLFDWSYEFKKIPNLSLEGRKVEKTRDQLRIPPGTDDTDLEKKERKVVATPSFFEGIGNISGEFYVYDRDREVLRRLTQTQLITDYLDENGGIRVYRDGIRIYNYGEPGDDWLGLDLRRVNKPTRGISRNIILGGIHLSLESSLALKEKTNREGFVENDAYFRLRRVVLGLLATLESERRIDKDRIRQLTSSAQDPLTSRIEKPIESLRKELDKQGVREKFEPYVAKIEKDYQDMQQTLLSAGMSGLNLAVVFHEVERGVRALHSALSRGANAVDAAKQAQDLMRLLDGFARLLRKDSKSKHSARELIIAVRKFNILRLDFHRIELSCPLLDTEDFGFESKFSFGLVLGALNNLVDNAIYWLRVRWPDLPPETEKSPRKLFIGITDELEGGPSLVVADNGPGFEDDPEMLVRPFFTRRPEGMGLGLYYAKLAMELNQGSLALVARRDIKAVPRGFSGAVAALTFKAIG